MKRISSSFLLALFFSSALGAAVPHGFYDVTAHGADPKGVVDSTAALQAAIDHSVANQLVVWFPPGTYRISDRLVVDQPENTANFPGILMGSTVDAENRASLYLAPNSPGFNDPTNRRVMVHFVNIGIPGSESGGTDLYDQAVIGLDFKVGAGNDGAVALRMQGAEGCTLQDVRIDLTEGGHTGIWGPPGSGGSTHRVSITGGVIGIDTERNGGGRGGTQPTVVITGSTFINQTGWAVRATTRGPLVMVGCRFERDTPGTFFEVSFHWAGQPLDGSLQLIDSELNYLNADPGNIVLEMGSPRGRTFYFDNVFVRNAPHVFTPDAVANPTGWRHFRRLAVEVLMPARSWGQGRELVYIDGVAQGDFLMEAKSDVPPPFDLQSRHQWAEDFPTWETPGVVDVTTLGAVGDGVTDNWAILQQAINDHEILFFPKGRFAVSSTLDLRPDSKIIGAYSTLSSIDALSSLTNRFAGVTESDPDAPIIRTADTAEAETWLANIHIRRFYPLASHNPTPPGNYALEWRSGGNSLMRHVKLESRPSTNYRPDFVARFFYGYNTNDPDAPDYNPINPYHPQADFLPGDYAWTARDPNVQVRGNGGGRWFNFWFHGRQHLNQETPFLRVEGTTQPLHIYHLHMQQQDSRNISEFINAANISIYGTKGEIKGAMAYFENCDNVRVFGNGGLTTPNPDYFDPYLFRFINCTNFLISGLNDTINEGATSWKGGAYDHWIHANLLTWYPIEDRHPLRDDVVVPSTHRPSVYLRGNPRGQSAGGLSLTVAITAPESGTTVFQGTYVTFSGTAQDENEGDLSATAAWTSSIDGLLGFGPTLTTGSLSPGNHTITFSATNSTNGLAARAVELTVVSGGLEQTTILAAEADTYVRGNGSNGNTNFGTSVVLRSRGNESSEALYRFNLAGLFGNVTSSTLTLTLSNSDSGGLRIHDVADNTWEEMEVTYNTRPILAAPFTTVTIGGGSRTAHDIDVTASVAAALANGKVSFGTTTEGSTLIRMRSREGSNSAEHPRLSVTTITNVLPIPPNASITAPANDSLFAEGVSVGFSATATDSAANDLASSGQWSSSIDGILGAGASLNTSSLSRGVHIITFSVQDADGLTAFAQILVRVKEEEPPPPNLIPVATISEPSANTFIVAGDAILLEGTVIDPEDGDLTASATWTSTLDGILGSGGSLSPTLSLGLHSITFSATDSDGATATATRLIDVIPPQEATATLFAQDFSASSMVADYQGSGPHLFNSISTANTQNRTTLSILDGRFQGVIEYLDDGSTDQLSTARLTRNTDLATHEDFLVFSLTARAVLDDPTAANLVLFNFDLGSNFRTGAFNPAGGSGNGPAFLQIALEKRAGEHAFGFTGAGGTGVDFTVVPVGDTHVFEVVIAANNGLEPRLVASPIGTHSLDPQRFSLWVNGVLYHDNSEQGIDTSAGLTQFSVAFGSGTARSYASGLPWNGVYDFDDIIVTTLQAGTPNTPPVVAITAPADTSVFTAGDAIGFTGTATDAEDGDIAAAATWSSSIDGALGAGGTLTLSTLSVGSHTITFSATDSGGLSDSAEITLTVEALPPMPGDPAQPENSGGGTGTTFYLDAAIGNDTNDGLTPGTAWQTFAAAIQFLQPGDTVLIREGDYNSTGNGEYHNWNITTSGTPGQYITFRAYPGERPRFHVDTWNGIQLWNVSYIELDGLEIIGLPDPEWLAAEPENSPARNTLAQDRHYFGGGITVTHNGTEPHHIRIRNCVVHSVGGNGIGFRGGNMFLVENNTINNSTHRSDAGNSAISFIELNSAIHPSTGYGVVVRGNHLYGNRNMVAFKWVGYITDGNGVIIDYCQGYTGDRILIANNLAHHNGGRAFHVYNGRNVDIIHNTAYHNLGSDDLQWSGELSSDAPGGETNNSINFHNNIAVARADRRAYNIANTTNWIFTQNLTQSPRAVATTVPAGSNLLNTDPQFVHAAALDFRLLTGSPAIGYGQPFAAVPTDFDGAERSATTPDLGAFEGAVLPPPPPTYTVSFIAGVGGTLTGDTNQTVTEGDSTTGVTAVPDEGYSFVNWTWNGGNSFTANPLSIVNIITDLTVTAHFEAISETAEVTLIAEADTYVRGDGTNADTNYGINTVLRTRASELSHPLYRFDLSSVSGTIVSATLRLTLTANDSGALEVNAVLDNTWEEMTVTYNTRPAFGANIATVTASGVSGTAIETDVTAYVAQQLATGKVSFGTTGTGTLIRTASRENSNQAVHPRLIVVYSAAADPFETWTQQNALSGDDVLPGTDLLGDGMPNLLRYALGGTPETPVGELSPALSSENARLTLSFHRIGDADLVYEVWASGDLVEWGAAPIWSSTGAVNVEGPVIVSDIIDLTPEAPRFLRLKVSR